MSTAQVVVGIDGSQTAREAMYWAAAEASRRNVELLVAHAGDAEYENQATEYGESLLAEAEAAIFETDATCPIRTRISADTPVRLLTDLSRQAELVVVGSHGLGRTGSALLGSVAFRVASHACSPVAVIPRQWVLPSADAPVLLGVSGTSAGAAPLHYAFAEADRLQVPVLAVRTWSRIDWTGDVADLMYKTDPAFEAGQYDFLDRMLAPVRAEFPGVRVRTLVSAGKAHDVLQRESVHARLLVLGARFGDGHRYSRLGPITARLLHSSACPAVVVGHKAPSEPATAAEPAMASHG